MATRASKKSAGGAEASEGLSASERIDGAIAGLGDWRGERLAEIRRLIREADAEVVEEWKWIGSPVFSHDGIFVVANAHKEKVKLTFAHGAQLADRNGLFNAGLGGKKWRAIDLFEGDELDGAAFKELVREVVGHNAIQ